MNDEQCSDDYTPKISPVGLRGSFRISLRRLIIFKTIRQRWRRRGLLRPVATTPGAAPGP